MASTSEPGSAVALRRFTAFTASSSATMYVTYVVILTMRPCFIRPICPRHPAILVAVVAIDENGPRH